MSVNSVTISGNVGTVNELRYANDGETAILTFTVAVNERRKVGNEWKDVANWVECTLFGRRAESLVPYIVKGTKVMVQGRLHQSTWNANDGTKRSKITINVDEIDWGRLPEQQPQQQQQLPAQDAYYDEDVPF